MTNARSRFLAFFLALCLGLSIIPAGLFASIAQAESYGVVVNGSVRLRRNAAASSAYWFMLPEGWVCTIHSETNAEGQHWYRVIAPHPDAIDVRTARTYWGYIPDSNFRPLTDEETAEYQTNGYLSAFSGSSAAASSAVGESAGTTENTTASASSGTTTNYTAAASGSTGSVTNGGTNFREGPGKNFRSIMKLDRGTVVSITSVPDGVGSDYWYGVSYGGYDGYINSEFIRVISGNGAGTVTVSPVGTPTAPASTNGYNAAQLILSSAHLRTSPNGTYNRDNDWEGAGSILPLAGGARTAAGHTWYPVERNGTIYFVRDDCVRLIATSAITAKPTGEPTKPAPTDGSVTPTPPPKDGSVTPTPPPTTGQPATPTPAPAMTIFGYVQTVKSGCNLRATVAGTTIKQIAKNVTLPYLANPVTQKGYTWYYVDADGLRGYLRGDVVKVVSSNNNNPVTANPAITADPAAKGYVKTTASDVNLRTKAGYSATLGRVAKGTVLPYYGDPTTVNGVTWYRVYHSTLGYGYLHGSYVAVVNADGSATPTPVPTEAPTGAVVTGTTSQVEAGYSTLKLGSTGSAVTNLVQALKDQGFYSGTVTSKYTTSVQTAVKAFQKKAGLSVDGIAGEATQHALYGTVPYGAADSSNLTMTIYPAEKIDWWTGGINELWTKGANYKVYDVKTGIVWWAHRWSGGYHVDAEPLTAADTARLCKAYGVTTADEIKNKNLYERRPCLVTIGNRTFACSLYGIPHNYPEGDTISTNNFKGQLCLHFTNSWTHGSKKVDSLHTEAIQYAYENAPNGHK